jgi:hypothetical protein
VTRAGLSSIETPHDDRRAVVLGHLAVFAIGATSAFHVMNFTATVLSVICLLLAPAYFLMKHRAADVLPLLLAAAGWVSYLASAVVNGVSVLWPNALAPAAFSLYFVGLTVLTGRAINLIATVLAGVAVGSVYYFLTTGIQLSNSGSFGDLWKYGIAPAVTILILFGMALAKVSFLVQSIVLAVVGFGSLGLNFRSHAMVCLLAAATLFTRHMFGDRIRRGLQFAGIIALALLFYFVLPIVGRAGVFGTALQKKIAEQEATNLPMFMVGRTEPPESITAILQRPWLGWGSSEKLTPEFYTQAEHMAVRMGYDPNFDFALYWRLHLPDPSAMHSILLGSWAEGGVVAMLLPLWLLIACLGIVWNNTRFGIWGPLALTVALQGIWDLLYAPWTYNTIQVYVCIALLFCAVHFRPQPSVP